jgi:uncharacterized protein YqjF (DUF2071 family)
VTHPPETIPFENRLRERARPAGSPVMYQRWQELLFLHWSVDPSVVTRTLPRGLSVDTFEGRAWIGVVPFEMRNVRPRFLPALPGISNFPELNLRTYVVDEQGRPGVWFYSLDTPKSLPNWIARTFFHLNYRLARMQVATNRGTIDYRSELSRGGDSGRTQRYSWKREGAVFEAEPDSLEFFLAERYRLFAHDPKRERILTGQVHHVPYPLQGVNLGEFSNHLFETNHLEAPLGPPQSAIASAGVDVAIYPMERVVV